MRPLFAKKTKSPEDAGPSLDEVESAIQQICSPGALCYAQIHDSNRGFAAQLSFNTAEAATASGGLEVRLREARLVISSIDLTKAWDWNDEIIEIAQEQISTVERTTSASQGESEGDVAELEAKVGGRGKAALPFASAEITADLRQLKRKETRQDRNSTRQTKRAEVFRHVEIERRPDGFWLNFHAAPHPDLTALNPAWRRVALIDVPEESRADSERLLVDMRVTFDDDEDGLKHSFHVKSATGAWRSLRDDPNRRIMAELLLSKFLPAIHQKQRLWPQGAESD